MPIFEALPALIAAPGLPTSYPIDRLVLAANDARGRTDQDRT